jgi:hypothetical protein
VIETGDLVEFAAELLCRLHVPGSLTGPPEREALGQVVGIHPAYPFVRVRWYRGQGFAGRTTLVALCHLWAQGKGVPNECPRCAAGKCGGAFAW